MSVDLEAKSAPTAAAATPGSHTAPQTNPPAAEPEYVFPDTSKQPVFHIDQKNGSVWIGFKANAVDYEGAKAILQAQSFDLWKLYVQMSRAFRMREEANQLRSNPKGIAGLFSRTKH